MGLNGPANKKSLCSVATRGLQEPQLKLLFHALRCHLKAKTMAERYHGTHDGLCACFAPKARNERLV